MCATRQYAERKAIYFLVVLDCYCCRLHGHLCSTLDHASRSGKNKVHFIKKFLRLQDIKESSDRETLHNFIADFLHHDDVFLLRMISMSAGDIVTAEAVVEMWDIYKTKYKNTAMLNDCSQHQMSKSSP